jgi:AAHS family 4-hydroxybenzoate transporter-like MFS transporter
MAEDQVFDISAFIDNRGMNRLNATVVIFCFVIVLCDGYDIGAVAFAGPSLVKAWGITNMAALGTAFSAGLFGILFGSLLFGWVGDRYGRTRAIIGSLLTLGFFSLATVWAGSLSQLISLRFLTGIGIGGLLPNPIALNAEFAPKRLRATMIIISFSGITLGGAIPGPVAAWLVPRYGWEVLFVIGGLVPIAMAIAAAIWLPESIKHLAIKSNRRSEVVKLLQAMKPGLAISPNTRFVVADEQVYQAFRPIQLFGNGLHFITPLLWLLFVCTLMSFFFVNSWLPVVLTSAHIPVAHAALATSVFQAAGTIGGLALCRPIDRFGFVPLCAVYLFALIVTPLIGYATQSEWLLMVVVFFSGFTLFSLQFGINATSAMIYPTSIRSNGSGWAFGVGRCGAVAGPIVAGVLIGMHLSIEHLFLFLAIPLSIATVASLVMARLYYVRFEGVGLGRRETMDEAARAATAGG